VQGYTWRRQAARLFHLERTKAERWRNANKGLQLTAPASVPASLPLPAAVETWR